MIKGKYKTLKMVVLLVIIIVAFYQIYKLMNKQLDKKRYDDITTNMLVIQKKAKMINGKTRVNVENEGYVGKKVTDIENKKITEKIMKAGISEEDFEDYYVLYMSDFEKMGIMNELKRANSEDYIVNYKENEVCYTKGVEVEGKKVYKLSEILSKNNNDNDSKKEENSVNQEDDNSKQIDSEDESENQDEADEE